jgi:type I restriction enzyme R subunit
MEPNAFPYAERRDNIEAIFRKLREKQDGADVTAILKDLHRIVNDAIRTQGMGEDHAESVTVDLSQIDFEKLREELGTKVRRKRLALQEIRALVEEMLAKMLAQNPARMDFYKKYQIIIADYNREKDRATIEETFARLLALHEQLDAEQQRAVTEGLSEEELALFDLLNKGSLTKAERERLKQASRSLLSSLTELLATMPQWANNAQTQAEVEVSILDSLYESLPMPPFAPEDAELLARKVYNHVYSQASSGTFTVGVGATA